MRQAKVDGVDDSGWTALMTHTHNGRVNVVRALLEHKANTECKSKAGTTVMEVGVDAEVMPSTAANVKKCKELIEEHKKALAVAAASAGSAAAGAESKAAAPASS